MSDLQGLSGVAAILFAALALAGLARYQRLHLCRAFPVYLAAVALGDLLAMAWPGVFFTWSFYVGREVLYAALKLAIVLQLAAVCFDAFPGARAAARRALLLVLAALAVAALLPAGAAGAEGLAYALQPRVANGTAGAFLALWALVLWYRIPIHPIHFAILKGFVPYLLVSAVNVRLPLDLATHLAGVASRLSGLPYVLVLSYWAWAAWRPEEVPDAPASLVRRLQPWRFRA